MKSEQFSHYWRWFLLAAALEAGAAFFALLSIPHEGSAFSLSRLAVLGVLLGLGILWAFLGLRHPDKFDDLARPAVAWIAFLLAVVLSVGLFLLRYMDPERLYPYYLRLNPLLFYLTLFFLQSAVWILLLRYGLHAGAFQSGKPILIPAGLAFLGLSMVGVLVVLTHLGLTPDSAYWGEPGVPVLGWQAALAILAGLIVLLLGFQFHYDRAPSTALRTEAILAGLIWLTAVILWLSVPMKVMQNSFYAPINPPSNQPYPNSDAAYYDYHAQSALLGMGYLGGIPTRPLYIFFLALLHLLFGQNYGLILAGQACVLALLPVSLFFLGTWLHSRPAGAMAALFAIFRELTSLWISSNTRVSNTRTLMSDLPTTLLIVVTCLVVMRWLERKNRLGAILSGGVFGALLLLRTQSLVILPFILLLAFLIFKPHWREWIIVSCLFGLGSAVTVAPWLVHNYYETGRFVFDDPSQLAAIASQYATSGNLEPGQFSGQTQALAGNLIDFTFQHPAFVLGFISNHFLATEINSLVVLPLMEPFAGIGAPINIYWFDIWQNLSWVNALHLAFYLLVIALGLGAAWKRWRWLGLAPLFFNLGYALANGIGRFSGWRYDLPADWISYFFLCVGMAEIFQAGAGLFGARAPKPDVGSGPGNAMSLPWKKTMPALAAFALLGFLPWLLEILPAPHFSWLPVSSLVQEMSAIPAVKALPLDQSQIRDFLNGYDWTEFDAEILQGRVLYPRFYRRDDGIVQAHPSPAYAVRDYARVGFLLMNQQILPMVFPTRDLPQNFPQGADVIVLGCKHSQYVEAKLIVFLDLNLVYQNGPLSAPCLPYDQ